MNDSIQTIFDEVTEIAILRNGEVVQEAFDVCGITCADCEYPRHAAEFERLLILYVDACLCHHRKKRRIEQLDNLYHYLNGVDIINVKNEIDEFKRTKDRIGEMLQSIRPCQNCKQRYNPTRRTKYGLKRWPQKKEYLNVD